MKFALLLCVMVAAVMADDTKYTTKYDGINLDEILGNDRLLHAYYDCIMDKGKCTAEGKELKDNMQDAIATGCAKCSKKQEEGAYKVIEHLIKNKLELWHQLTAKYDPTGEWRKKYEDRARANGIQIPK